MDPRTDFGSEVGAKCVAPGRPRNFERKLKIVLVGRTFGALALIG